jgi:integrase
MARSTTSALSSWEYPKKSGIRIREMLNNNGGEAFGASYLVTVPSKLTGKLRERKQFKNREEAEKWANDSLTGFRKQGEDFFSLSDEERREVAVTLPLLRKHGITLGEAARFAVKHLRPEGRTTTVAEVVAELSNSKEQRYLRGDLRERSYRDFRLRSGRFANSFQDRVAADISGSEIKSWVESLKLGVRSNQNYLAVIGEVFKLATQRRYVAFSPLDELTDIDRKELCGRQGNGSEPSILTPSEAERLLLAALSHPELELLGAVVLALFCGLRTEEIKRLDWSAVKLEESPAVVTIGSKIAKKRRIRHVEIPDIAVQWLTLVRSRKGAVSSNLHFNDHQKRFKKLLNIAGFKKWEINAMRHSFGSYHYALHGNALETARLLGHKASDQVLFDHYRALSTKLQAAKYFSIPLPNTKNKILHFTG